jgi:hypothetical protein
LEDTFLSSKELALTCLKYDYNFSVPYSLREALYNILTEYGIPKILVRLIKTGMHEMYS